MASTIERITARTDICGTLCDGWLMNDGVYWKKSSPDDFFETPHRYRRQKASFLPPALARSCTQTSPDVIELHPVLAGIGREAVGIVVRILQHEIEALVLRLQLQVHLGAVVDVQPA